MVMLLESRPQETVSAVVDEDVRLMRRLAHGEEEALAALYDRHGRVAFALAIRIVGDPETAEEVVQEVFLAVWRRAATYDVGKGSVRGWLLAAARNRAIDMLRMRQARPRTTRFDELPLISGDDPARAALAAVDAAALRTAVAALPVDQRTAVELAYFAGLSYPEIAAQCGIPLGTVKSRLRLALERLRAAMAM